LLGSIDSKISPSSDLEIMHTEQHEVCEQGSNCQISSFCLPLASSHKRLKSTTQKLISPYLYKVQELTVQTSYFVVFLNNRSYDGAVLIIPELYCEVTGNPVLHQQSPEEYPRRQHVVK
jgi:hypothetical protein